MEWLDIKRKDTKELIANSIGIYYVLKERNSLYKQESIAALSLYSGVLRMGPNPLIKESKGLYIPGQPYLNGYYLDNKVCQILNKYNINIDKVIELLGLDKKYLKYTCSIENHKIEQQYKTCYMSYLKTIRDYYVGSLRIQNNKNKQYCPEIDMTIPNIISSLYYPNIDSNQSISTLISKITNLESIDESLKNIESISTYNEELCKCNKSGKILDIYQKEKPLVMNKSIGRIL